jgi:hypothetical protein
LPNEFGPLLVGVSFPMFRIRILASAGISSGSSSLSSALKTFVILPVFCTRGTGFDCELLPSFIWIPVLVVLPAFLLLKFIDIFGAGGGATFVFDSSSELELLDLLFSKIINTNMAFN